MFVGNNAAAGSQDWHIYRHLWADFLDDVGSLITHVVDVRTLQEIYLWTTTAFTRIALLFYM
jgi:hypothetical protein